MSPREARTWFVVAGLFLVGLAVFLARACSTGLVPLQ